MHPQHCGVDQLDLATPLLGKHAESVAGQRRGALTSSGVVDHDADGAAQQGRSGCCAAMSLERVPSSRFSNQGSRVYQQAHPRIDIHRRSFRTAFRTNRLRRKSARNYLIIWWVLRDSNPRHSPCKGDALPTELSTPGRLAQHGHRPCRAQCAGVTCLRPLRRPRRSAGTTASPAAAGAAASCVSGAGC